MLVSELRYHKGDEIGGRYRVHEALAGGMSEVYLCLDLRTNFPFALKALRPQFLTKPKARAYFAREAGIWVSLEKHPNVVRCFHMETVDNVPFLFLEWVAAEQGKCADLRDWLSRRGPLKPRRALEFTLDICRALRHAQNKVPSFVHCDIKPDNVLIAQGHLAKLTDFGLSRLVREAGLVTYEKAPAAAGDHWQFPSAGGTAHYMAPELWRRQPVDARTDLYAVGCLLYELVAGHWPFQAATNEELERQHLEAPPPPLGAGMAELPDGGLDRLLARCLAKEMGDRYQSASELMVAITELFEAWRWEPARGVAEAATFTAADYGNRGVTYAELGRQTEALADYDAALRIDPNFASAYYNRGNTYQALARHAEAATDYDAAIRLDPTDATAYVNRGAAYAALDRHAEALADYDAALLLDPTLAQAHSNRGITYLALGRDPEALIEYDAAIRLDPTYAMAYVNKGVLHTERDEWDEALRAFEMAARLGNKTGEQYAEQVRQINELPPAPCIADEEP